MMKERDLRIIEILFLIHYLLFIPCFILYKCLGIESGLLNLALTVFCMTLAYAPGGYLMVCIFNKHNSVFINLIDCLLCSITTFFIASGYILSFNKYYYYFLSGLFILLPILSCMVDGEKIDGHAIMTIVTRILMIISSVLFLILVHLK